GADGSVNDAELKAPVALKVTWTASNDVRWDGPWDTTLYLEPTTYPEVTGVIYKDGSFSEVQGTFKDGHLSPAPGPLGDLASVSDRPLRNTHIEWDEIELDLRDTDGDGTLDAGSGTSSGAWVEYNFDFVTGYEYAATMEVAPGDVETQVS